MNWFRGREKATTGDGFLAIFDSASRAVGCGGGDGPRGREGRDRDPGRHPHRRGRSGSRCSRRRRPHGRSSPVRRRSGEVVVSATTRDLLEGSDFGFVDAGSHELKGLSGARSLYRLAGRGAATDPGAGLRTGLHQVAVPDDMAMTDDDGDGMIDPSARRRPDRRGGGAGTLLRHAATLTAALGIAFSVLFTVAFVLTAAYRARGPPTRNSSPTTRPAAARCRSRSACTSCRSPVSRSSGSSSRSGCGRLPRTGAQSVLQSNLQLVSGILFVALFFIGAAA